MVVALLAAAFLIFSLAELQNVLDALAKAESANWVWKGATCLAPDDRYCLTLHVRSPAEGFRDEDWISSIAAPARANRRRCRGRAIRFPSA